MDFSYFPEFWMLALVFIIGLAAKLHYSKRYYKLAALLPGPPAWPVLGNAFRDFQPYATKILYDLCRITREYDGFVRLWFGGTLTVFITRLEDLEVFFSHPKLLDKSSNYDFFSGLGVGLFTANGEDYRRVKKYYISTYNTTALRDCLPTFVRRGKILLKKFSEMDGRSVTNMHPLIFHYAFTAICDISLEYDLDGKEERYQQTGMQIEYLAHKAYERVFNPLEYSDFIYPYTQNGKNFEKVRVYGRESLSHIIRLKRKELNELKENNPEEYEKKRSLFITRILEDSLPEQELVDHVATMIGTGSDTTASTISFSLMMLGSHPEIQQKVYEEVMAVHEKLAGRPITADDLEDYRYLEMVLKETLRLFPVAPLIARRANEDIQFPKYLVPKGSDVFFLQMEMNRDPKRYPNPLEFDPERFRPELCEHKNRFEFVPFSVGPRACIGAKFAMMSMKVTVASIIRNFKVYSDKKVTDITLSGEVTLKPAEGCQIRWEKRHDELI